MALPLENSSADYPFAGDRYDHGLAVNIDPVKPDFDLVTVEQVFLQEGTVLLGNVLEEFAHFGAILRYKRAQGYRSSIPKTDVFWIGREQIARNRIISHGINLSFLSKFDRHRDGVHLDSRSSSKTTY